MNEFKEQNNQSKEDPNIKKLSDELLKETEEKLQKQVELKNKSLRETISYGLLTVLLQNQYFTSNYNKNDLIELAIDYADSFIDKLDLRINKEDLKIQDPTNDLLNSLFGTK